MGDTSKASSRSFRRSGKSVARIEGQRLSDAAELEACVDDEADGVNRLCTDTYISGGNLLIGLVDTSERLRVHLRSSIGNPYPVIHSTYTVPANKVVEIYTWNCDSESSTWLVELQVDGVAKDAFRSSGGNDNTRQNVEFTFAPIQATAGQVISIVYLEGGNNKEATSGFSGVILDA